MNIIINGIEPQFKIYKMTESIENKFYIGKTKQPIKVRMNSHRHGGHECVTADNHFADVGWRNVTVEIIDSADNEDELKIKEEQHIRTNACELMLNKYMNKQKTPKKKLGREVFTICKTCRCWSEEENKWITKEVKYTTTKI